jgi:4-amino-4-deoxy-L-arabinose transferase-like glycosyltransferase
MITVIRLTAPSDIDNRDQVKQGLYILDVVQRGSFFLPVEHGHPSTKPPLYTWVAAAISLVLGGVTDFTIRLPAVLSGLGVVLVTYLIAELLFSAKVGLIAGLILILNYHFSDLSSIARTDMMQCFFISLSLHLFLLAYRKHQKKSICSLLMFVAMGLGSITKSPVAFILPGLIVLIFLFLMKDLNWLKLMQIRVGIMVWLLIMLGWFIPAVLLGGHNYFDIVVIDEMVNRFLGMGTRAEKTRPFYYLMGHFFGKFQPWSLFVPSAIGRYWKFRNENESDGLLFVVVWFLAGMIFFSISGGKRADYLLPLYPAASLMLGYLWHSLIKRDQPDHWQNHLRTISLGVFILNLLLVVTLFVLSAKPDLTQSVIRRVPENRETLELIGRSINAQRYLFMAIGLLTAGTSVLGVGLARWGRLKNVFIVMVIAAALNLSLYFEIVSPNATSLSGQQKKEFCLTAREEIESLENLQFFNVKSSIFFYMGKNVQPLKRKEVLRFLRGAHRPYLITNQKDYLDLRERIDAEIVILKESEYLVSENTEYVLIGRKNLK